MTNILLSLLVLVNIAFLAGGVVLILKLVRLARELKDFVSPVAEGQPSPLATSVQVVADMVGRSVVASVKATFMGMQSGDKRAEQAIQGALLEDSPVGTILQSFPALRRTLKRNPGLLDVAMGIFGNMQARNGGAMVASGNGQPKFKL